MSEIDWDKAPEGATHYWPCHGSFYTKIGDKFYFAENIEVGRVNSPASWVKSLIPRPSPAWSGEGLPPVGVVCEYFDNKGEWYPAVMSHIGSHLFIVKYQHPEHGQQEACMHIASNDGPISSRLRPIRTPEQIAAEVREAACEAMLQIAKARRPDPDVYEAIATLYDAGYRKP